MEKKEIIAKSLIIISLISVYSCIQPPKYSPNPKLSFTVDYDIDRFETNIKRFEEEDKTTVHGKDLVVFYGSSSFVFWKNLKYDLSPLNTLNRGFGGSTIPELIKFADRTILNITPSKIIIYGGENDMSGQTVKSPEQVLESYKELTTKIYKKYPKTKVYFISIKPSIARKALWPSFQRANELIEKYSKKTKNQHFIDVSKVMMNEKGEIDGTIFTKDSLHMNPLGYERWTKVVRPILMEEKKENK